MIGLVKSVKKSSIRKKIPHPATVINYLLLAFFSFLCLAPFVFVISMSLTSEATFGKYGTTLLPKEISFDAYKYLLDYGENLFRAYGVSIFVTIAGTLCSMIFTTMFAYGLSRRHLPYRNVIMTFVLITMLFNGGMIPNYLLINSLGLIDNLAVLIVPGFIYTWNMIIMRNYFLTMPDDLIESAKCDGAGEMRTFLQIVLPVSKPILATIALFYAVGNWNMWFPAALYLPDSRKWPAMMFLKDLLYTMNTNQIGGFDPTKVAPPSQSIQMACVVVVILPILASYPFAQKYFVKGIMMGSLKG